MKLLGFLRRSSASPGDSGSRQRDERSLAENSAAVPPKTLILCRSAADYARAVLQQARRELGGFPVLVSPELGYPAEQPALGSYAAVEYDATTDSTEPSQADLCAEVVADLAIRPLSGTGTRCIVLADDEAALVAASIAVARGYRLSVVSHLEDLEREAPSGETSLLVASCTRVHALGLDRIRLALTRRPGERDERPWGVLTASSLSRLSALAARSANVAATRAPARLIFGASSIPRLSMGEDLDVWRQQDLDPSSAARLAASPTPVALFSGHGRPYCFQNGLLCSGDPRNAEDPLRCVGDFRCIKVALNPGLPILRASALRADVVFVDSCLSAAFIQSAPAPGRNLAVELVSGNCVAAVVPPRLNWLDQMHPFLFLDLLKRSPTLGDAVVRLNAICDQKYGAEGSFVLFGDPNIRPFADAPAQPIEASTRRLSPDTLEVQLPPPSSCIQTYICGRGQLPDPLDGAGLQLQLTPWLSSQALAHLSRLPGDEFAELTMVWLRSPPAEPQTVVITAQAALTDAQMATIRGVVEGASFSSALIENEAGEESPPDDQLPPLLGDMRRMLGELDSVLARQPAVSCHSYLASPRHAVVETSEELLALAREANEALVKSFTRRRRGTVTLIDYFSSIYGVGALGESLQEEPCPACGGLLQRKVYRIGSHRPVLRWYFNCDQCEILCDVEAGAAPLAIRGPLSIDAGSPAAYEVRVTNAREHPAFVDIGVDMFTGPVHIEGFDIDDAFQGALLEPREERVFRFCILPHESLLTHEYRIKAYVASNGSLGFANKMIQVSSRGH